MASVLKFLSTFLLCTFFFKAGVPTAVIIYEYDFLAILLVTMTAGITGNIVFTYASAAILKAIHDYRVKRHTIHTKKIFTRSNRKIIRIKNKFGLAGIALIGPMFLSIPIGAFLAERFFRDKKKIILYFTISEIFWTVTVYFILFFFHDQLKGWLL